MSLPNLPTLTSNMLLFSPYSYVATEDWISDSTTIEEKKLAKDIITDAIESLQRSETDTSQPIYCQIYVLELPESSSYSNVISLLRSVCTGKLGCITLMGIHRDILDCGYRVLDVADMLATTKLRDSSSVCFFFPTLYDLESANSDPLKKLITRLASSDHLHPLYLVLGCTPDAITSLKRTHSLPNVHFLSSTVAE